MIIDRYVLRCDFKDCTDEISEERDLPFPSGWVSFVVSDGYRDERRGQGHLCPSHAKYIESLLKPGVFVENKKTY